MVQRVNMLGDVSKDGSEGARSTRYQSVNAPRRVALLGLLAALVAGCNNRTSDVAEGLKAKLTQKVTAAVKEKLAPSGSPAPDRSDPPPALKAALYAFQPSFATAQEGTFQAGKMVVVKIPDAPDGLLALSCIHIFGPEGGLSRDIPSLELPAFIKQTTLLNVEGKGTEIGAAIPLSGTRRFGSTGRGLPDASTDISVFRAPATLAGHALDLASENPNVGDRVWLLAQLNGGAPPDVLLHPAHVRLANDQIVVYEFENNALELRATSGAPVVDAAGKLVALNLGGGLTDGKLNVFGNPVSSLREKVRQAAVAAR